jgi:hypothetical protein
MVLNRRPSEFFAPAPLLAVALLGLNDHLGKALFHNAVTGKLSDVALCFFLPLLVSAALRPLWRHDRARLTGSALLAAAVFATLELSLTADAWFSAALAFVGRPFGITGAVFTRDPWDLLALALVPVAHAYGLRRLRARATAAGLPLLARVPVLAGTLLLLGATSPGPVCSERSAPVAFRVSDGCAGGGLIVVDPDEFLGRIVVHNGDALFGASEGEYDGGACPFRLDRGGWWVETKTCARELEPGVDAGRGPCGPGMARRCQATLEGEELWIACQGGGPGCRARLTLEGQ